MKCYANAMNEVTKIIESISKGDRQASEQLLPIVYNELRTLAASQLRKKTTGDSFQATELVHEAFLRLVDVSQQQSWDSRGHFFAAAAESMRRILVERARKKSRLKHGGDVQRVTLYDVANSSSENAIDLIALDEALNKMVKEYPLQAKLVNLRYFAGLTSEEAGKAMGISRATAARYWTFAKAWLLNEIEGASTN